MASGLLREAFADWDILDLREYEAEVTEGTGHKGMSALIGMVAQRRHLRFGSDSARA